MRRRAAAAAVAAVGVACVAPPPPTGLTIERALATAGLAGTWTWTLTTQADGVTITERERWELVPAATWPAVAGTAHREVEVVADDGVPFTCAQRPRYTLAADRTITVAPVADGVEVAETSYQAAPSPCEHGLRQLATYRATITAAGLVLRWPGGLAHLARAPTSLPPLLGPAPTAPPPAGAWEFRAHSWTAGGQVQREREQWDLAVGDDGELAGWYLRTVEVLDPAGATIACAGADRYQYVDRYLVRGRRAAATTTADTGAAEAAWDLREVAVEADPHPCLAASPRRVLDGAAVEVVGQALVLTWRGARRQVLWRPTAYSDIDGL
ncbi:MAG: hypothetical protein R3B06_17685 [Kofleriaceae bacterium]